MEVALPGNSGPINGYLARPAGGHGPGVIVIGEWCTLDAHARLVCDLLAGDGFVALAPELARSIPEADPANPAARLRGSVTTTMIDDAHSAARFLHLTPGVYGRVGVVGFFLGGGVALSLAARSQAVGAVVVYYCVLPDGNPDFRTIAAPVLGHFGTADSFISLRNAKALELELRAAGVDVLFDKYTGAGHGFFNDADRDRDEDSSAAWRSWARTVIFMRGELYREASAEQSESVL